MSPHHKPDAALWMEARTLADLGELMAQWLEGRIRYQPGYGGPPDPETTDLIADLAALNRAGSLPRSHSPANTTGSGSSVRSSTDFAMKRWRGPSTSSAP